jgi:hypothetical protein
VIRRCRASLTVMVATLAIYSGLQPPSVNADGITSASAGTADYTLTSTVNLAAPTGPVPGTPSTTLAGTVNSGSTTVTLPNTSSLAVGYGVSGTGIPSGTTVTAINSASQVTLSQGATANGSETLLFTPTLAQPQVIAEVVPAGGVVTPPSSATQGPLTILSASPGIKSTGVYDFLATTTPSNGQPIQGLGLSFYGNGLQAGDTLQFALNVANQSSPPQLNSLTQGVTITLDPPSTGGGSGSSTTIADSVPEPLSLLLWSALAGAGLIRARGWRRTRRAALAG